MNEIALPPSIPLAACCEENNELFICHPRVGRLVSFPAHLGLPPRTYFVCPVTSVQASCAVTVS